MQKNRSQFLEGKHITNYCRLQLLPEKTSGVTAHSASSWLCCQTLTAVIVMFSAQMNTYYLFLIYLPACILIPQQLGSLYYLNVYS